MEALLEQLGQLVYQRNTRVRANARVLERRSRQVGQRLVELARG